jgi:predicted short-subunit dehydrogenase-like oxidoreductase (DUF2520 family)
MFERVQVIGSGRAGGAVAARLAERGVEVGGGREPDPNAELVILAVPDARIPEVAQRVEIGPWVAHLSGATSVTALAPHERRFVVHPLQTLTRDRGAEQLDGAWGAMTFETDAAAAAAGWLATTLGLRPFVLADADKPIYHAGAAVASNFLVTLERVAARLVGVAGVPAEALVPLMTRTIDNGFQLTGPIARGDTSTVEAHIAALEARAPDLVELYRALAEATKP